MLHGTTLTFGDDGPVIADPSIVDENASTHRQPQLVYDEGAMVLTWVDNREAPGRLDLFTKVLSLENPSTVEDWNSQTAVLVSGNASVPAMVTQGHRKSMVIFQDLEVGAHRVRGRFIETESSLANPERDGGLIEESVDAGHASPPTAVVDAGIWNPPTADGGIDADLDTDDATMAMPEQGCGCSQSGIPLASWAWILLCGLLWFRIRKRT